MRLECDISHFVDNSEIIQLGPLEVAQITYIVEQGSLYQEQEIM